MECRLSVAIFLTECSGHIRALRELVENAVREVTPGWQMRDPSVRAFSLENGAAQLRRAFISVTCVRAEGAASVRLGDAEIAADYVASAADHYEHETTRPWRDVVEYVRRGVQGVIDRNGVFEVSGDVGAFICR